MKIVKNAIGRYELPNGGFLSSPSRILQMISLAKYKDMNPAWLEMARDFGIEAHNNIEMFEKLGGDDFAKGEVIVSIWNTKQLNLFNQYLLWKEKYQVKVLESELLVYSLRSRYFGYIDQVVEIRGEKYIVDLKTRNTLKSDDNFLVETLQLMLYKQAWQEIHKRPIKIALLIINKNTKSKRLFKVIDNKTQGQLTSLLNGLKMASLEWIKWRELCQ